MVIEMTDHHINDPAMWTRQNHSKTYFLTSKPRRSINFKLWWFEVRLESREAGHFHHNHWMATDINRE